ncbi:beta-mannosidase isoform X1 [Drosophila santomea]|uniref:beta-mannosidase isoform X1 n=1 Tax=Drosophila santomea TaxID=129105 RepID=UPI001953DC37|nr:beta-mannosidase isoform X1 [Drosophila santomea]XP_039491614.1 beta-mannosidase isoform X1 [Drosophila santomea]
MKYGCELLGNGTRGAVMVGLLCGLFVCGGQCDKVEVIELGNWTITNQNGSLTIANQTLPLGIYSAFAPHVLDSFNDVGLRYLAYDNWTLYNFFQFDVHHFNRGHINLTFHGIDTVAEIRLNHQLLGRTDNMFVRYSYEVSSLLQAENSLEVEIQSPVVAALARANALKEHKKSVPPECPNERYHGECHMNMLRKMQASFSWDWGPAAPSAGIWKNVELEIYEVALIREVDVDVSRINGSHWNMHIRCYLDTVGGQNFNGRLVLYAVELLDHPVIVDRYGMKKISHLAPVIEFDQAVPIGKVVMWWPNGYGEQKLYPLHFTLKTWLGSDGPEDRSKTQSHKSVRVGFRTLELVEDPAPDGVGNTFFFRVNGVEMFMKGSNYIPSHILPERQTKEQIAQLLRSAKEAHMNMIRVWGGGVYESDYFYQLADSLGLLIWQDMMFACAMYPVGDDFLSSVREEVRQNAIRLSHHPSVAIFVTNNENEAALVQNWYGTLVERDRFESEYRELYLANVIHELKLVSHSARPQPLVSSPSNGKASEPDNYISNNPQDNHNGDVHFYDYTKDGWNPDIFPRPRFVSEFGFQSFPGAYAWQRSKSDDDDLLSLITHRQHHPLGNVPIIALVERHLPLPLPEDENYAKALIYFSQIAQAMATKLETELYRSLRDTSHRTMGALYWQLNDVWVAPSWSSVDFYGNWKLLHYWARDFLAPISIVALYEKSTDSLNISLICDQLEVDPWKLNVVANVHLWSQLLPRQSIAWEVTLRPNGVQYDKVIAISDILKGEFSKTNAFIELQLRRDQNVISRTHFFPSNIAAAVGIEDPRLEFEIASRTCLNTTDVIRNSVSISIQVKRPAVFVYLELLKPYRYTLSENGFMQTAPMHVVYLTFDAPLCARLLRKSDLRVLTVNDFMR